MTSPHRNMNPFDYVKSINEKKYIDHVRDYNPFLANRSLSYHLDTALIANEMNKYPNLPAICQYDFLYHTIRKGRRYGSWYKADDVANLEMIMEYYQYSKQKALAALEVLTQDQLRQIKMRMDKGGV